MFHGKIKIISDVSYTVRRWIDRILPRFNELVSDKKLFAILVGILYTVLFDIYTSCVGLKLLNHTDFFVCFWLN